MPKALGKVEHKIAQKLPGPVTRFYENYHVTIKQLVLAMMIAAIAVIGLEARNAKDTATKAKTEVQVIKQSANCAPDESGNPLHPKKCAASISTGFRTLSPRQACELLQKGSKVIFIGGQPIPPVTCDVPQRRESRDTAAGANGKVGSTGAGDVASPASSPAGSPEDQTPGAAPQQQGSGGQPSQDQEDSPGGSAPEGDGGSSPTGSPGSSGDSPIVTNPPADSGGGGSESGASKGGLEETADGVGKTVEEVIKPLCEPGLLGVRVCILR